jgi:undecaprenyl diphosphate synthase
MRAGEEIPDFLIWQSIYSELYFLDIDWKSFRYVDFMRCIRDYQRRERRYGK